MPLESYGPPEWFKIMPDLHPSKLAYEFKPQKLYFPIGPDGGLQVREHYAPAKPSLDEIREALERADQCIYDHGWHQGSAMHPQTGAVCAETALAKAVQGDNHGYLHHRDGLAFGKCKTCMLMAAAYKRLVAALPAPYEGQAVPNFNDADATTEADIHELYRRAIKATIEEQAALT